MKVFVYRNLHRQCWSVKALEGPDKGRVIAHRSYVMLRDVRGKVSEAGRQRVLTEGRKNVHAGLVGTWQHDSSDVLGSEPREITYNPRKYETFVYTDNEAPFEGSDIAFLVDKTVHVAYEERN